MPLPGTADATTYSYGRLSKPFEPRLELIEMHTLQQASCVLLFSIPVLCPLLPLLQDVHLQQSDTSGTCIA